MPISFSSPTMDDGATQPKAALSSGVDNAGNAKSGDQNDSGVADEGIEDQSTSFEDRNLGESADRPSSDDPNSSPTALGSQGQDPTLPSSSLTDQRDLLKKAVQDQIDRSRNSASHRKTGEVQIAQTSPGRTSSATLFAAENWPRAQHSYWNRKQQANARTLRNPNSLGTLLSSARKRSISDNYSEIPDRTARRLEGQHLISQANTECRPSTTAGQLNFGSDSPPHTSLTDALANSLKSDQGSLLDEQKSGSAIPSTEHSIPTEGAASSSRSQHQSEFFYSHQRATEAGSQIQCGDDMAAGFQRMSGDARKYPSSNLNRSENRPPMSNILCRNGPQCRKFQEGCVAFQQPNLLVYAHNSQVPATITMTSAPFLQMDSMCLSTPVTK